MADATTSAPDGATRVRLQIVAVLARHSHAIGSVNVNVVAVVRTPVEPAD